MKNDPLSGINVSLGIKPPQLASLPESGIFWPWIRQVIAVVLLPIAFELFEGSVLGWSEVGHPPLGASGIQIFNAAMIAVFGFAFGLFVPPKFRGRAGPFVWVVPATVLALAATYDLRTFHSWRLIWTNYFFWANPGADEGPILRDFLTYPALCAFAYSAAAFVLGRKAKNPRA